MKRLMSDEELREKLRTAYYVGWHDGNWPIPINFDDWYEGVYGGPDCE
jgi:hypothetical protein